MKKIININLSGRVIPIEDSAYEKLQGYIESLRRYFAKEEGRDEIINDIESRIAELMNDKIRKGSTAITDEDVNEIIASMGRPEDFDAEENETYSAGTGASKNFTSTASTTESTGGEEYHSQKRRRFYRDSEDRILGGVCSGLASYLNVDPAIIRILFAIVSFGGFGLGFLLYILLWIFVPSAPLGYYSGKRLFRNPDDRIFGGVASGLAAYFKKETWVIRVVFAAPFLINLFFGIISWPFFHEGAFVPNIVFGSVTSTFILIYIILWIVLPEARSDYERMEMRGEKVDVNTIRQNVKDRAKDFSEDVKTAAQNIGTKAKDFGKTKGKEFAGEVREAARRTGSGIAHIIGVLFKSFFLFIAGSIAFALFVMLMALIFGGVNLWPFKNFILDGPAQNIFAWGTLLLFLGVPLVGFIVWLVRRIMKVKSSHNYLGWTFGALWTLGWVSAALLAASLVNDFRMAAKEDKEITIVQPTNGKLILRCDGPEVRYNGSFWMFRDHDDRNWDITEDTLRYPGVKIRIDSTKDDNYHVIMSRYSAGKTTDEAARRAENIIYNVSSADSVLNLGSVLSIAKDDRFRLQRLIVTVKVPVGKKVKLDPSLNIYRLDVRLAERERWYRYDRRNIDWDWDNYFSYDTEAEYIMGSDYKLINPNQTEKEKAKNLREEKRDLQQRLDKIRQQEKLDSIRKAKEAKPESIDDIKEDSGSIKTNGINTVFTFSSLFN